LLESVVAAYSGPELEDNVDFLRFPDGVAPPAAEQAPERLGELLEVYPGLASLYETLRHPEDRDLLVAILTYRILGHRKARLGVTATARRSHAERAYSVRVAERTAPLGHLDYMADDFDLAGLGFPLRLRSAALGVVHTFVDEQYRCPGQVEIGVEPGDVIIDGGAFWGETALYFALKGGPESKVLSLEADPNNLAGLRYNLDRNPEPASQVEVVNAALWSDNDGSVAMVANGPGSRISGEGGFQVRTHTIDALLDQGMVERVDFIKLDIEGAELPALIGAEATLRRYRPRLAIAAYHRPDDLARIPEYLTSLGVGYQFRLRHLTMNLEETVLFGIAARPRRGRRARFWLREAAETPVR
jgi:FkbM family methyltransferase